MAWWCARVWVWVWQRAMLAMDPPMAPIRETTTSSTENSPFASGGRSNRNSPRAIAAKSGPDHAATPSSEVESSMRKK